MQVQSSLPNPDIAHGSEVGFDVILTQVAAADELVEAKRPRKLRQRRQTTVVDGSTPKPARKSRARKPLVEDYDITNLATQQTPMSESQTPGAFGPPPPNWTPTPTCKYLACSPSAVVVFGIAEREVYFGITRCTDDCTILHRCAGRARGRKGRLTREEKGKAKWSKPRNSAAWRPPPVVPNPGEGMRTRALAAQFAEEQRQRENDEAIAEVLAHFASGDDFDGMVAPESQHTVDSLHTCSINLWEDVFRDNAWRSSAPITKQTGFGVTH